MSLCGKSRYWREYEGQQANEKRRSTAADGSHRSHPRGQVRAYPGPVRLSYPLDRTLLLSGRAANHPSCKPDNRKIRQLAVLEIQPARQSQPLHPAMDATPGRVWRSRAPTAHRARSRRCCKGSTRHRSGCGSGNSAPPRARRYPLSSGRRTPPQKSWSIASCWSAESKVASSTLRHRPQSRARLMQAQAWAAALRYCRTSMPRPGRRANALEWAASRFTYYLPETRARGERVNVTHERAAMGLK